jgi:streptogramin lyase
VAGHPFPHAAVKVWNITPTIGFNPGESVEDISGLTGHVATIAAPATIAATIENTTHFEGPCGLIFWNPATNVFKWYGITGGSSFGIDLNHSAPLLTGPDGGVFGAPTFGPGNVWVTVNGGSPPLYVNFTGTDNFRFYFVGGANGVQVDQATGRVYFTDLFAGTISALDPATNALTTWAVGGAPHFLALDSSGKLYSAVATAGVAGGVDAIVRIDPAAAVGNVTSWAVPGGGLEPFLVFATPDGVTLDSAGTLWFTESVSNEIGRLNPATGEICEFTKTGLANPQLVGSSGSGGLLQTFFTEGAGNAVSIVTQAEAVPVTSPCPIVAPVASTVTPSLATASFADSIRTPLTATITPDVFDVPGVDGTSASGTTTTADGTPIPGILRFPMPTPVGGSALAPNFPSGMTGVVLPNTVFGSYLDPNFASNSAVFEVKSPSIIAPVPGNDPPDCSAAGANPSELWPPNHRFVPVGISGVTDPDGDAISITVLSVHQDEPVKAKGTGSGNTCPDGNGVGTDTAEVRAERAGNKKVPGDGRVYHIRFMADDGQGGTCEADALVCVPHDQGGGSGCIDGGPLFDSTVCP